MSMNTSVDVAKTKACLNADAAETNSALVSAMHLMARLRLRCKVPRTTHAELTADQFDSVDFSSNVGLKKLPTECAFNKSLGGLEEERETARPDREAKDRVN